MSPPSGNVYSEYKVVRKGRNDTVSKVGWGLEWVGQ